jgi:capsule biosynthesis phosphatase
MKKIIIDLDNTLTKGDSLSSYKDKKPKIEVVNKLRTYKSLGFTITIFSARSMKTFEGNIGIINVKTLPKIIEWLEKNDIPFDEVLVGKPWCGEGGFYVDDKAIRPQEFIDLNYDQIKSLINT